MSNYSIEFNGEEFHFPNILGVLQDTLKSGADPEDWCKTTGSRTKRFTDKEMRQFNNLDLYKVNIYRGVTDSGSDFTLFQNATLEFINAVDLQIAVGNFQNIEPQVNEIKSWLEGMRAQAMANLMVIKSFITIGETGWTGCSCQYGRCGKMFCHNCSYWENHFADYEQFFEAIADEIEFLDEQLRISNGIEEGTIDTNDFTQTYNNHRDQVKDAGEEGFLSGKRKGMAIAGGVILGLIALFIIVRKIRN